MWKSSYIFAIFFLLSGCAGQRTMTLHYEAGLYRFARSIPKKVFDLEIKDQRETNTVGQLLSNRGWKLGTLKIQEFINETYKEAIITDLQKAGFQIEKGCRQKVVVTINELESTFAYESFRPVSKSLATIQVALYYNDEPLFSKKYMGAAKNTYYVTGEKVAVRNAMDSIQNALINAFTDREFLQTIIE